MREDRVPEISLLMHLDHNLDCLCESLQGGKQSYFLLKVYQEGDLARITWFHYGLCLNLYKCIQ